ncbi:hypothetical protein [Blastococcus sp. SYSU D00820]
MSTAVPAVELLRRYYDDLLSGDGAWARERWTAGTVLHYPGHHRFSGVHDTAWTFETYFPAIREKGDIVKEELLSPIAGDEEYALSHYRERLTIAATGEELVMGRRCLYHFRDGDLAGARILEEDQAGVDAFIEQHFPG